MQATIKAIYLIGLIALISCQKNIDVIDKGIVFSIYDEETNKTSTILNYEDILGYDSSKYVFVLDETAWEVFKENVMQTNFYISPYPDYVINVNLNRNLIYRAAYIPSWSDVHCHKQLFKFQQPNLLSVEPECQPFEREDLRNDHRLIEQLKSDNKLVILENF